MNPTLVGVAYFLAAHFSIELSRLTDDVAALWPPNGALLAVLLVSRTTDWTRYAVAAFAAVLAVNLFHGDSVAAGLGFAFANLVECVLAAAILRNRGVGSAILASVRHVLVFVSGMILAAAVGASLGAAAISSAYGGAYWSVWPGWWVADLLGLLVITPLMTAWYPLPVLCRPTWVRVAEAGVLLTGLGFTAFAAFGGVSVPPLLWPVLLLLAVPFQKWAAVRFDRGVVTTTAPLVLLGGILGLKIGDGLIPVADNLTDALLLLQAVLAVTSINAMTLVAAMHERRTAEAEARIAEARLRDAVDSMSDAFELYDVDDRLALHNDRGNKLLPELADILVAGASYEEIVRKGAERGLYVDAAGQIEAWIADRLRQHRDPSGDCELRLDNGRWLLVRERRTKDGGILSIRSDITHLKQQEQLRLQQALERRRRAEAERLAEQERRHAEGLERLVKELTYANRELDEFSYIASHDLQEPLRKLIAFSQLLVQDAGDSLPERAKTDLAYVEDAARRMQSLVQDLLALSRAGNAAMRLQPISLTKCVDDAIDALTERIRETDAAIVRDELPEVMGDRTLLTQLYQNLIGNALKFAAKNRKPVISLTADRQDGSLILGVQDNGIGIEPSYAEQIFAPFKRLHSRTEYEGNGIGLAICRKVVERHAGEIWVESEAGKGAHLRFTVGQGRERVDVSEESKTSSRSAS